MTEFTGLRQPDRRILVITGHYGSGKTEFCVSLAFRLAKKGFGPYKRLALIDLDIANPYFRSRERKEQLAAAGVAVRIFARPWRIGIAGSSSMWAATTPVRWC